MKRLKRSTPREGNDSSKPGLTARHDQEQLYCLERLCRELEHANASRRDGACAAINWLGRLVNRAPLLRISCEGTETGSM
jgi:hypothetical protein